MVNYVEYVVKLVCLKFSVVVNQYNRLILHRKAYSNWTKLFVDGTINVIESNGIL